MLKPFQYIKSSSSGTIKIQRTRRSISCSALLNRKTFYCEGVDGKDQPVIKQSGVYNTEFIVFAKTQSPSSYTEGFHIEPTLYPYTNSWLGIIILEAE